jgi:hypothetical protein
MAVELIGSHNTFPRSYMSEYEIIKPIFEKYAIFYKGVSFVECKATK